MSFLRWAWNLEFITRPVHPQIRAALVRRWTDLPAGARTPAQRWGGTLSDVRVRMACFPAATWLARRATAPATRTMSRGQWRAHARRGDLSDGAVAKGSWAEGACAADRWRGESAVSR